MTNFTKVSVLVTCCCLLAALSSPRLFAQEALPLFPEEGNEYISIQLQQGQNGEKTQGQQNKDEQQSDAKSQQSVNQQNADPEKQAAATAGPTNAEAARQSNMNRKAREYEPTYYKPRDNAQKEASFSWSVLFDMLYKFSFDRSLTDTKLQRNHK